jgi:signal transduction histidine kinase
VRVGDLVVSTPGRGVALRAAERRLLADLARQSGAAAHGVATLTELRRSRERLVAAREEERRSLRRELHDDLGAMLTGVALGVDAAGNRLPARRRTTPTGTTALLATRRTLNGSSRMPSHWPTRTSTLPTTTTTVTARSTHSS